MVWNNKFTLTYQIISITDQWFISDVENFLNVTLICIIQGRSTKNANFVGGTTFSTCQIWNLGSAYSVEKEEPNEH